VLEPVGRGDCRGRGVAVVVAGRPDPALLLVELHVGLVEEDLAADAVVRDPPPRHQLLHLGRADPESVRGVFDGEHGATGKASLLKESTTHGIVWYC
jgi:hypothetical protein